MTNTRELALRAPKTGPWIIGYAASVGTALFLTSAGLITDMRIGALLWIPMTLCIAMVVHTSWRRNRLFGTLSTASRVFWRRIVTASLFTFAGFAVSGAAWEMVGRQELWSRLLALLPYAGFAGIIWSVHQYIIDEADEYLRAQAIRQTLIAGFFTLMVASIWGGFGYTGLVGPGWVGIVILIWFGGMGIGRLCNELRP